jgi:type I restriction enzyme R subunit
MRVPGFLQGRLMSLRENVSVDWAHRDSARARMRVLVKRILRKYGYPPDLQDTAVQTVLQQAEALSSGWSVSGGFHVVSCGTRHCPARC